MNINPELGGERKFIPETESDFEKWQHAGPEARRLLLLEESNDWPPVESKKAASPKAREFALDSSRLAVEASRSRR